MPAYLVPRAAATQPQRGAFFMYAQLNIQVDKFEFGGEIHASAARRTYEPRTRGGQTLSRSVK